MPRQRLQLGADARRGFPWRPVLIWGGLALAVLLLILRFFVVELVTVRGNAMAPNLLDGDAFIVAHYEAPTLGSVVLLEHEGRALLRRVVGLPGDRISTVEGQLVRDDEPVETSTLGTFAYREPLEEGDESLTRKSREVRRQRLLTERLDALTHYAILGDYPATARPWALELVETTVPDGHLFVLCDNRRVCGQGAFSGVVAQDWVVGVVGSNWWQGDARVER